MARPERVRSDSQGQGSGARTLEMNETMSAF